MYRKQPEDNFTSLANWEADFRQAGIPFEANNRYGFPDVARYDGELPEELIAYNSLGRLTTLPEKSGIHFYLHDSKFDCIWNYPARAMTRFNRVGRPILIGPDFSMYTDYPVVANMYNKFRSHWCMALWQAEGFSVIPNVCWSTPGSFAWAFDGFPKGGTLAISTVGLNRYKEGKKLFNKGLDQLFSRLKPDRLLVYGLLPEKDVLPIYCQIKQYKTTWNHYQEGNKT